jgi:hypothetical protein
VIIKTVDELRECLESCKAAGVDWRKMPLVFIPGSPAEEMYSDLLVEKALGYAAEFDAWYKSFKESNSQAPATGKPGEGEQPSQRAFQAYWLTQNGLSQERIAEMLHSKQGTVSKWLAKVKRWKDSGNAMPEIPQNEPLHEKPLAMDPDKIDLGRRPDGRTEGQRVKMAEIQGHDKE